jgi:nucleotide-binding universal stress UspA family protein/hemerythrin-like domain-containing protein
MYRHLLVPLDGSELATTLVSGALELACVCGARITFFTMRDDYGASDEGALVRAMAPDTFNEVAAGHANAIIAKAIAAAESYGVQCDGLVRTGSRPYELIVQVARERSCDLIYMGSHGRRGLRALLPGSQTQKVIAHASVPVLVATVETNSVGNACDAAIAIILDEHRAIAAVCNGLRGMATQLRTGAAVDLAFLDAMLHYLRNFSDELHHPKEEQYLFARLAGRSVELDDVLAVLAREHSDGADQLAQLEERVGQCRGDATRRAAQALAADLDDFVDAQWRHLSAEEKIVLPAARRQLNEVDWQQIGDAFRLNGELSLGGERGVAFERLFARLMNQAADAASC